MPCPDAGDNPEIQLAFVEASHVHSGCVVIASEPVPPPASIIGGDASDTMHFTGFGPVVLTVDDVSQPETSTARRITVADEPHLTRAGKAMRSTGGLGISSTAEAARGIPADP